MSTRLAGEPTTSLGTAISDAEQAGVGVWAGALGTDEIAVVRELTWAAARSERGFAGAPGYDLDALNLRVMDLISVDQKFRDLAFHPVALRVVEHFLGPGAILSNFNANITGPGSGSMHVHADQGFVIPPWPSVPLALNCIWAIDEFAEEVGATRYVPGSNRATDRPATSDPSAHETRPILGPAGSMVILDGRVWHTTGPNRTADRHRIAIFGYYIRPWLRQQVNWNAALAPDVVAQLTQQQLDVLGYGPMANVVNLMGHES
jgi:ectoine hydroxylase-related dioxygenase (phytanoyl-CoA dioxygenase family)